MGPLRLVLFDDRAARQWMPFVLTRPAGELRFGAFTLRERAERVFGARCLGHLAAPHLAGFDEPDGAPVLDPAALPPDADLLFLSSRAVPAWGARLERPGTAAVVAVGGEPCGWYAPAGGARPPADFLLDPAAQAPAEVPVLSVPGTVLARVWQLVTHGADQLARDLRHLFPAPPEPASLPPGVHRIGPPGLVLGERVSLEPGVVIDTREGPVWLEDGVTVRAFTRLAGPAHIGRGSTVLGGPLTAVSIGPVCKVHGEVEETIVLGYANKAHDGFLGHAYVGRWVNLGALTTNSDLKNNYGPVRMWTPEGEVDTGELKLGCLLGDHVKTAIGTLLNTGTVVGAGANLFGPGPPPKYVPPFRWGTGPEAGVYDLDRFLATAEAVMARRNVTMTAGQRAVLRAAWELARQAG